MALAEGSTVHWGHEINDARGIVRGGGGAGFGGIYQLKKLLDQGLKVKGIDMADDVGGTWYWNHYPGAMSE